MKLSFTWLGVRKTLALEQRTTAARAFHADRELLSVSKLILDGKNPGYRAVAAVRSEAWREDYNRIRPHASLGQRTPFEFARRADGHAQLLALSD